MTPDCLKTTEEIGGSRPPGRPSVAVPRCRGAAGPGPAVMTMYVARRGQADMTSPSRGLRGPPRGRPGPPRPRCGTIPRPMTSTPAGRGHHGHRPATGSHRRPRWRLRGCRGPLARLAVRPNGMARPLQRVRNQPWPPDRALCMSDLASLNPVLLVQLVEKRSGGAGSAGPAGPHGEGGAGKGRAGGRGGARSHNYGLPCPASRAPPLRPPPHPLRAPPGREAPPRRSARLELFTTTTTRAGPGGVARGSGKHSAFVFVFCEPFPLPRTSPSPSRAAGPTLRREGR